MCLCMHVHVYALVYVWACVAYVCMYVYMCVALIGSIIVLVTNPADIKTWMDAFDRVFLKEIGHLIVIKSPQDIAKQKGNYRHRFVESGYTCSSIWPIHNVISVLRDIKHRQLQ
jgi:hypothetical protein